MFVFELVFIICICVFGDFSFSCFRYDHYEGVRRSKQSETRIVFSNNRNARLAF